MKESHQEEISKIPDTASITAPSGSDEGQLVTKTLVQPKRLPKENWRFHRRTKELIKTLFQDMPKAINRL